MPHGTRTERDEIVGGVVRNDNSQETKAQPHFSLSPSLSLSLSLRRTALTIAMKSHFVTDRFVGSGWLAVSITVSSVQEGTCIFQYKCSHTITFPFSHILALPYPFIFTLNIELEMVVSL
jgi:hypothetical protein